MKYSEEELSNINEEIEKQLIEEMDSPVEKKQKKQFLSLQFVVTFILFLFILLGFLKVFF